MVHGDAARRAAADPARRRARPRTSTGRPARSRCSPSPRRGRQPDRPRRAGVSSFGISGTNAHVDPRAGPGGAGAPAPSAGEPAELPVRCRWLLSGRTPTALRDAGRSACSPHVGARRTLGAGRRRPARWPPPAPRSSTGPSVVGDRPRRAAARPGRPGRGRSGAGRRAGPAAAERQARVPVHRPGRAAARDGPRAVRGVPGVRRGVRRGVRGSWTRTWTAAARGDVRRGRGPAGPDRVHAAGAVRGRGGAVPAGGVVGRAPGLPGRPLDRRARRRARGGGAVAGGRGARWSRRAAG